MVSMVGKKVARRDGGRNTLMAGGSQGDVIARYRELVADNIHRLMA